MQTPLFFSTLTWLSLLASPSLSPKQATMLKCCLKKRGKKDTHIPGPMGQMPPAAPGCGCPAKGTGVLGAAAGWRRDGALLVPSKACETASEMLRKCLPGHWKKAYV